MASLAHNLNVRRAACKTSFHGIVVGWIGDAAHQAEHSDHNPDARGIVHAIDVMVTKHRAQAVVEWALAHPADLEYVIHNRTIWTRSHAWKPKRYTGADPHTNHVHISGKHGSTGKDRGTATGYDVAAEESTPTGSPRNAASAPAVPIVPHHVNGSHRPGSRELVVVTPRMSGDDVQFVQRFIGSARCGAADGFFGPDTRDGVTWYQRMRGIAVDGRVGPETWHNMGIDSDVTAGPHADGGLIEDHRPASPLLPS